MRDDLLNLFQKLVLLYENNLSCLDKIRSNEIRLRYLLRSDNVDGITDVLEEDKEIFIKLGSIEFDIRSLIGTICKTAGIKENLFTEFFLSRDEDPLPHVKKLKDTIDKKAADLIRERDELIRDMEGHLAGIKADIDSLQKIRETDLKKTP